MTRVPRNQSNLRIAMVICALGLPSVGRAEGILQGIAAIAQPILSGVAQMTTSRDANHASVEAARVGANARVEMQRIASATSISNQKDLTTVALAQTQATENMFYAKLDAEDYRQDAMFRFLREDQLRQFEIQQLQDKREMARIDLEKAQLELQRETQRANFELASLKLRLGNDEDRVVSSFASTQDSSSGLTVTSVAPKTAAAGGEPARLLASLDGAGGGMFSSLNQVRQAQARSYQGAGLLTSLRSRALVRGSTADDASRLPLGGVPRSDLASFTGANLGSPGAGARQRSSVVVGSSSGESGHSSYAGRPVLGQPSRRPAAE